MLDPLSTWLRQQRLARAWSIAEMGRQLQRAAKAGNDHTVPGAAILATYVRRWEAAKITPTERYRLHYCKALGIPATDFGPPQPDPETADGLGGVLIPGSAPTIPSGAIAHQGADLPYWPTKPSGYRENRTGHDTPNHTEHQPHTDPPLNHLMAMLAEESLNFGEWADTSNTGDATLENYAAQVRRLASSYQRAPLYPLLLETKRLRDRVFAKLQGHQRPGQTRDLYLIASQVCGILAWISGDLSYQRTADAHAWTGWVCAEHADHDGARAWVRAIQSKLAYWDGRFTEATQLAEDGLRYHSPDSGQIMVPLQQARALARLGRDGEAVEALSRAATALEQTGPDEIGGFYGVSQGRYHHLVATTHMLRQDPGQVLAETRRALTVFEAMPTRERDAYAEIGTRMDEAHAHLLSRDLDGASMALRPVLEQDADSRTEPLTQHLRQVRQVLGQPEFRDAALAQQLQEEIETYCRESIVNDLPG